MAEKAVRILTRSPRYGHTNPIFANNYILNSSRNIIFYICKFIQYDFCKNKIFNCIPRSLAHSYNTRYNTDFSLAHVSTNLAANFVLHMRVKIYNSLANDLICIDDFQKFKRTYKSCLLKTYL